MTDVKSPCVNVCALGDHGFCIGCFRSAAEIARWSGMTSPEKRDVWRRIDGRALELGAALSAPAHEDHSE